MNRYQVIHKRIVTPNSEVISEAKSSVSSTGDRTEISQSVSVDISSNSNSSSSFSSSSSSSASSSSYSSCSRSVSGKRKTN